MSKLTDDVIALIKQATDGERRLVLRYLQQYIPPHALEVEWNTTAEEILTAIARSSDLTLRGIRGILAEATFGRRVIPNLEPHGWQAIKVIGDQSYDFLLARDAARVRVQVKLQRKERGTPKEYSGRSRAAFNRPDGKVWVVEVQKTRSGEKAGVKTRPYRFDDFDILAVSLHPSTGEWEQLMYTVGNWLLPRASDPDLIEIFQPVPSAKDEYWTDDLSECIEWFLRGEQRRLYAQP